MSTSVAAARDTATTTEHSSASESSSRHHDLAALKPARLSYGIVELQDNATFAWRSMIYHEVTTAAVGYCTSQRRIVTSIADAIRIAMSALHRADRRRSESALREALFYERLGE